MGEAEQPETNGTTEQQVESAAPAADPLDTALARFTKIKEHVGEANVKSFLDSMNAALPPSKRGAIWGHEEKEQTDAEKAEEMRQGLELNKEFTDTEKYQVGFAAKPEGHGAKYAEHNWDMASIKDLDNVAELESDAWKTIMRANKILHGFGFNERGIVSRARFPAFQLVKNEEGDEIPHFEVFDDSFITIKETVSQKESSMASNGFSSNAISASASGGFGGFSAAASASYEEQSFSGRSTSDFSDRKEYTACYTFPRARVFVDDLDLAVADRCEADLNDIRSAASLIDVNAPQDDLVVSANDLIQRFYKRYGTIFATQFLLGGQMTATQAATSVSGATDESKRDQMKWSAAASFSTPYGGASVSGGQEKSSETKSHNSFTNSASSLAWSARGGNTLLAAKPAEWANSVATYQTWRTMEQDGIQPLTSLFAKLNGSFNPEGFPKIDKVFRDVRDWYRYRVPVAKPVGPASWSGRFILEGLDGGALVCTDDGKLMLSLEREPKNPVIFCAFDASAGYEGNASMEKLLADWPIFLPTHTGGTKFARDSEMKRQVPGLWVDSDGYIRREVSTRDGADDHLPNSQRKICRWSLVPDADGRDPLGFDRPWAPEQKREILDGTPIKLYCHSYYAGAFKHLDRQPGFAPVVHWSRTRDGPTAQQLRVPKYSIEALRKAAIVPVSIGIGYTTMPLFGQPPRDGATVLAKTDAQLQAMMELADLNDEPGEVSNDLDFLRRVHAIRVGELANSTHRQYQPTKDAFDRVSPQLTTWGEAYVNALAKGMQDQAADWRNTTKFTDVPSLRVKYVT